MKIAEIIKSENLQNPEEIQLLKTEIQQYLQTTVASRLKIFQQQANAQLSPDLLDTFFRSQERQENTKRLLQYMLTFLIDIPEAQKISQEPVNPVEQFKEFIQYQVGLLRETDVIKAITRELNRHSLHEHGNIWYNEARVMDKSLELEHTLAQVSGDHNESHLLLFRVLENLCLFWFEIGREDVRQARRSDIYIFKLARLLQHKLLESEKRIPVAAK